MWFYKMNYFSTNYNLIQYYSIHYRVAVQYSTIPKSSRKFSLELSSANFLHQKFLIPLRSLAKSLIQRMNILNDEKNNVAFSL